MYGRGNYSNQFGQNQAPVRPPYQQQMPVSFPPGTPLQALATPPSAVNQGPRAPSHTGQSLPPLYKLPLAPPAIAPYAPTLQAPAIAMPRTITSGQSHVNAPLLPGPPLIPLSRPMSSNQFNAQRNPYPRLINLNAHHALSSLPPPPLLAGPSRPNFSQTVLPPRPFHPFQGEASFWPMVNPQPNNAQGLLPIPSPDPSAASSSGSVLSVRGETSSSSTAPQPPPLPPPPSLPSSLPLPSSEQKTERSLGSAIRSSESTDDMLNPSQQRIDAPIASGEGEDDLSNYKLSTQVGSGSALNGHLASDVPSSPPKPSDKKIVEKIEKLCKYIANNGPGFEDMARSREYRNPEFLFLFGGEPGSEAAIAHNYYQWLKKKYCSIERLPEGQRQPDLRQLEISSPVKPENTVLVSLSDGQLDSDMEMEDDITPFDKDESISKPAGSLSCGTDLIQMKNDVEEKSQVLQEKLDCTSPTDVSIGALPSTVVSLDQEKGSNSLHLEDREKPMNRMNEVQFDTDSPGSAELLLGGISLNVPAGQENSSCSLPVEKSDLDNNVGHIIKSGSPFRFLQAYASDDSSDTNEKPCPLESLAVDATGPVNVSQDVMNDLSSGILSKIEKAAEPLGESSNRLTGFSSSTKHGNVNKETKTSFIQGGADEGNGENNGKPESLHAISSSEKFQQEGSSRSLSDYIHKKEKSVKEIKGKDFDSGPVTVKVDEFGRLLREGVSDSDSDDPWSARRYNKRGRYRSPSRSPRFRRRRSIQRSRRENRSRSPSWSPRRRRSRSRSPSRRDKDFGGVSMRRGRNRMSKCFDFSRGRCYRGASCLYLHQDAEIEGSRHPKRNLQSSEIPSSGPDRSNPVEEMKSMSAGVLKRADHEASQSMQLSHEMLHGSFNVSSDKVGADPLRDLSPDGVLGEDKPAVELSTGEVRSYGNISTHQLLGEGSAQEEIEDFPSVVSDIGIPIERELAHQMQPVPDQPESTADRQKMQNETAGHLPVNNPLVDSFQVNTDAAVSLGANHVPQQMNVSTLPKSSDKQSTSSQEASDLLRLPQPPLPLRHESGSQDLLQIPQNEFATSVASQPVSLEGVSPYMLLNQQLPLLPTPPQATWNSMSLSQPLPHVQYDSHVKGGITRGSAATGVYTQNGQTYVAHATDFGPQALHKPYPTETPPTSYADQFQHQSYAAPQETYQSYMPAPDHPGFHAGNSSLTRESVQPFHCCSGRPAELPKSSQLYPYCPSTDFQYMGDPNGQDVSRKMSTSAYRPDLIHMSQASFPSDYGDARFRNHYNPYASTFDQPPVAKFGSGDFPENVHKVVGASLSNVPADTQGFGSLGPVQTDSSVETAVSLKPARPLSGGGQYDPIFDSCEPSSKSIKRVNDARRRERIHDHDVITDSNKPLDIEETNKRKDIGAFMPSLSQEEDGFGETADAEVGVVENASPSKSFALTETEDMAGEVETNQVKSPGKRKKLNESRSGKLFKSAIANFVKEVLRPSWRQGNMSKEAFKTIVKKTVDKVAGAMKNHRIPKSQAKIDQYIDSSQRKLTRLVMGYVDKYVKV